MEASKGVVRVGVRRWNADQPAEVLGPANAELGPLWVEVDGVTLPGEVLRQASHRFEHPASTDGGFGVTHLEIITSSYETVDDADPRQAPYVSVLPADLSQTTRLLAEIMRPLVDAFGGRGVAAVALAVARERGRL